VNVIALFLLRSFTCVNRHEGVTQQLLPGGEDNQFPVPFRRPTPRYDRSTQPSPTRIHVRPICCV